MLRVKDEVFVIFKHLKYRLSDGELVPLGYEFEEVF